jgi:hypothetical protein
VTDDESTPPGDPLHKGEFRATPAAPADGAAAKDAADAPDEWMSLPTAADSSFSDDDGEPTAAFDFRAPPPPVSTLPTAVYHEGPSLPWEQQTEAIAEPEPDPVSAPTDTIDSLFGEERFREYDDAPAQDLVKSLVPVAPRAIEAAPARIPPKKPTPPRGPLPKSQRIGIWVAGGLVAALAITGLFFLGTRIPDATPVAGQTPAIPELEEFAPLELPEVVAGPVAPGVHAWDELLGTECIEPYTSAWEEQFTVVDCAQPHTGQLVFRGRLDDSATDAYPGVDALQARMNLLCTGRENIDYAAAAEVDDIQFAASFPGTEDDWTAGDRDYFCFVSRASAEPLMANVATPPRPPALIPAAPAPAP